MDRAIGEYSTGNKRKLAIVLAFMHDPDLVIMDEPTSGLDPLMQERFYGFVREEQATGVTFFLSSHVLSEVQKICDRVGVIRDGRLVELEDVETLLDRTGERVAARIASPVDREAFAIDGAHEVTISGDGEPSQPAIADGGRNRTDGAARPAAKQDAIDGDLDGTMAVDATDDPEETGRGGSGDFAAGGREGTTVSFTYTGDYNALLERLIEYDILDLDVADAPLEDVFMRFYGEVDPEEASDVGESGDAESESDGLRSRATRASAGWYSEPPPQLRRVSTARCSSHSHPPLPTSTSRRSS